MDHTCFTDKHMVYQPQTEMKMKTARNKHLNNERLLSIVFKWVANEYA